MLTRRSFALLNYFLHFPRIYWKYFSNPTIRLSGTSDSTFQPFSTTMTFRKQQFPMSSRNSKLSWPRKLSLKLLRFKSSPMLRITIKSSFYASTSRYWKSWTCPTVKSSLHQWPHDWMDSALVSGLLLSLNKKISACPRLFWKWWRDWFNKGQICTSVVSKTF